MSTTRVALLVFALLVFATLAIGNGISRYGSALASASGAETRLATAVNKAREVLELRAKEQRVAADERPPQDVIAQINRTLAEVGIRSDRLTGLQPVTDTDLKGGAAGYRRQSVSATIDRLQPAEIGRFLAQWRRSQPMWIPTRLELYHVRQRLHPADANLYSMRVELTAIYVSDPAPEKTK